MKEAVQGLKANNYNKKRPSMVCSPCLSIGNCGKGSRVRLAVEEALENIVMEPICHRIGERRRKVDIGRFDGAGDVASRWTG